MGHCRGTRPVAGGRPWNDRWHRPYRSLGSRAHNLSRAARRHPGLQRLRQLVIQLLNQVRGELTLHEQVVVPPLFVEATELARRAAKPLPPRVIAFVTELNAHPGAVTDEDLNRLQIRGTDTYSRIRLPELMPLSESAIVAEAQAAFPDAPASQAVVLRWHLRGLNFDLALRKAALSAQIEAQKPGRSNLS